MNSSQTRRVIAAGMVGNVLEWYDFAIYGYFASAIGRQFFPHEDAVAQLLSAFGVFALGYLMRPAGGALVGHIGDQFGRRAALTFSVTAMAIPTFLIGLLPGYATLGLLAPAALTLLRMVQGLSVGGEYTSSMGFLVERAPEGRRGLMGALTACGAVRGHPARLRSWCGFCGQHVDRGVEILGLAHSLPARAHCGHRWLLSPPAYARDGAGRAAQTSSDRRDTARSLAHCYWICGFVGLHCRRLLCQLRLSRELAPNRRRHSAVPRTRDQFI